MRLCLESMSKIFHVSKDGKTPTETMRATLLDPSSCQAALENFPGDAHVHIPQHRFSNAVSVERATHR